MDDPMKVLCRICGNEYEWESKDIFVHPEGYSVNFVCRDCLKQTRPYKKGKVVLKN